MPERITILKKIDDKFFAQGCPVVIDAGSLLKDNQTGKVLVQVKFRNISKMRIGSCKICVEAYEPNGNRLEDTEYFYIDLNVPSGETFGEKIPIFLKNQFTRNIKINIREVVDTTGKVWMNEGVDLEEIPVQERIEDKFINPEEIKQYKIEAGSKGDEEYVPMIHKGLFMCTCGTLNLGEESKCRKCGRDYKILSSILNSGLKERTEKRLTEEEYQRKDGIYNEANNLMEKNAIESYRKAKALFDSIPGHKDGSAKSEKCESAIQKLERETAEKAKKTKKRIITITSAIAAAIVLAIVVMPIITPIIKYKKAQSLVDKEQYEQAYDIYLELDGYQDSAIKAKYVKNKIIIENVKQSKISESILFGTYDDKNIEWIILENNKDSALLVSKYLLDEIPYNEKKKDVTWETCTIRNWLNNEFINVAFTSEEKELIKNTKIVNMNNSEYGTKGGSDTDDNLFLLSIDEIDKYFKSDPERRAKYKEYGNADFWYSRTPGSDNRNAAGVSFGGLIDIRGNFVDHKNGIRPAMWISLE